MVHAPLERCSANQQGRHPAGSRSSSRVKTALIINIIDMSIMSQALNAAHDCDNEKTIRHTEMRCMHSS